jgi:NAD-dependent dihydropyrimidine dehydrogenase PreA subunit
LDAGGNQAEIDAAKVALWRLIQPWGAVCYYQPREVNLRRNLKMAYVIAEPCIGTKDTACVDACPVDCIHPKKDEDGFAETDQLFIDPVECIDCGACVPACPVSAIFALDDLPEKWAHYAEKNSSHFGR